MTESQRNRINKLIDEGYEFELGEYISQGFGLFQKSAGNFIGFAFVAGMIILAASLIPVIGSLASNLILTPALMVGGYLGAHTLHRDQPLEFGTFFKGFDYIGQLALAALVTNLIVFACFIPLAAVLYMGGALNFIWELYLNPLAEPEIPNFPLWSLLLLAPVLYFSIAYSWSYHFIAFYKMEFWDAMEMSRKIIGKKWGMFFLFLIVLGLLAGLGFLLFFVGILVAFPVLMCANYAAFADVTGLLQEEEEDDLVDHLVN
jgi:hypothetical protein